MNILLLSPLSPKGGISSWTHNILSYISENKINYLSHIDTSMKFRRITNKNILIRILSGVLNSSRLFIKLIITCIEKHPDTVHITSSASYALFKDFVYLLILKCFSINCVFHYRFGRIPELQKKNNWEWRLLLLLITHSYKSIVIDLASYKTLMKNNNIAYKVTMIPNPCAQDVKKLALSKNTKRNEKAYIFVGHIIPAKGVYELVQAFSEISLNTDLILIGPYEEKTKRDLITISKNRSSRNWLQIIGSKDKKDVLNAMLNAKALILPSYSEGFPNVILEAMACGCPIIATNVGAIPEMINIAIPDESAGICIQPRSVEEIKESIMKIDNDKDKRTRFSLNGKRKVLNNYTMDHIFSMYQTVWK